MSRGIIIVDECLSKKLARTIEEELDYDVLYVNDNKRGLRSGMPDSEIMSIADRLGAYIVTKNIKDFEQYDKSIFIKETHRREKEKLLYREVMTVSEELMMNTLSSYCPKFDY